MIALSFALLVLPGCGREQAPAETAAAQEHGGGEEHGEEAARGPHGGWLLEDGEVRVELAIHQAGTEPEFRAWAWQSDKPVAPADWRLEVRLVRLGDEVDTFAFSPRQDYLIGDGVVGEPHSFVVEMDASVAGAAHRWRFDSFEGRTEIGDSAARDSGIVVEQAGPGQIAETLELHGTVVPDPQRVYRIRGRYPGVIREMPVGVGDTVAAGAPLVTIEASESLRPYTVHAPSAGQIVSRNANVGEPVADEHLLTLVDLSTVWVELAAFQHDLDRVAEGQIVAISDTDGHRVAEGRIGNISPIGSPASQSMTARVVLPNPTGFWRPGLFVSGDVHIGTADVPLAVRRSALQTFRDWTVVFEKVGDVYEVRPVTLGRMDAAWAEVLAGLEPGAAYVTENSYVVKADIEKSGASHDH
jgi:cobalt-zinc-cadmium efflux system membrane fusion protein